MQDEDKLKEQPLPRKPEAYPIRIRPYVLVLGIIWTLVVSTSLIWNVYQTRQEIMDVARHQARVAYEKDVLYRRWNSMHGGVYVPVTEKSPPNPYLEISERDITSPLGVALTKMNPAYMTRQVHEMATEAFGVQGHITSLNPIRPANAPDPWETEALLAFQGGAEEISSVEEIQGQPYLRLMRPLFTENACLSCHAVQGYHLGDIRGGISVSLPMKPLWAMERSRISTLLLGHTFLWLLGLVGLGFGGRRLAEQIAERRHAEESLKQNRNRLERINDCLLELGPDHNSNINRLTSLCGELLGGTCALYSRLDGAMLCSIGQWQTPPDFKAKDTPAGHICYDLICNNKEDVVLINDLPLTSYGKSDPYVRAYGLQTYLGHVVKCEGSRVGSLCVVYQTDYRPSDDDRRVLGIIASAIGNEDRRRQAEQSLRDREAKLKSIFRAAPIGIGLVTDRILQEVNERFCEMIGYPREELIGQSARILYANQEEFERVGREKYSQITELGTGTVETLWKKEDGTTIHVLLSSSPLDPTDLTAGVTFTALYITERKRAEDTLRESEERFKKILDSLDVGVLIIDTGSHQIASTNPKALALLGASEDQVLGKVCHQYICPAEPGKCPISDLGQTIDASERILLTADGGKLPILKSVVQTKLGGHECLVESFIDISELRRMEQALAQSEQHFRTVVESSPDAIFVQTQRRFAYANAATVKLFGATSVEQLLGEPVMERFHPDYQAVVQERIRLLNDEKKAVPSMEQQYLKLDGTTVDVEVSAIPFLYENHDGALIFVRDITERKRAEEERRRLEERLQRAEKMEALGTMAGGVAHDLNNVLGIVVGYSELLLDKVDESRPERSYAAEILKGGERAAAIVQDLLTLTRRGVSSRQVLNLNSIVRDCQESPEFKKMSSYHPKARIETDVEADLLNISGSSVHLGKSFMNLAWNAFEAMPNGGVMTVKTRNQYLDKPISGYDEVKEGDYVVLSVSDSGEGIPASDLKRTFEPFYTKKVMGRSGTGLGLAVVWGTAKDHLGYINVESEEGKGTTFTLYFPVTREEISPEQVSVSASEYIGNGESILVVDDVKEQRALASTMLKKLNYIVQSVSSGEEALKYTRSHAVDLVVLDMIMDPGMDGLDTYRKMLEIHPHQKAIIVSGFSETERVIKAQELGAGAYVKKPYVLEKLGLAVRKELERSA
jgi:PAS domain S-box-containing protein